MEVILVGSMIFIVVANTVVYYGNTRSREPAAA